MDPRPDRAMTDAAKGARAAPRPILGGVRQAFAPWEDAAARPLVRFEDVVKRFGAATALAGVDLAIY